MLVPLFPIARILRELIERREFEQNLKLIINGANGTANANEEEEEKMGSLAKLAAQAQPQAEEEMTWAGKVKLACAHLCNVVADAQESGYEIKEASAEGEVNHDLVKAAATLMVVDHYGLYKEAGIDLAKVKAAIASFLKSPYGYGTIGGVAGAGTGALIDDENRLRGALIGLGAGAGAGAGANLLKVGPRSKALWTKVRGWGKGKGKGGNP